MEGDDKGKTECQDQIKTEDPGEIQDKFDVDPWDEFFQVPPPPQLETSWGSQEDDQDDEQQVEGDSDEEQEGDSDDDEEQEDDSDDDEEEGEGDDEKAHSTSEEDFDVDAIPADEDDLTSSEESSSASDEDSRDEDDLLRLPRAPLKNKYRKVVYTPTPFEFATNYSLHEDLVPHFWASVNEYFQELIEEFIISDGDNYETFCAILQENAIHHLLNCANTVSEEEETGEEVAVHFEFVMQLFFEIGKMHWLPVPSAAAPHRPRGMGPCRKRQLGGFFLLHFLYNNQPEPPSAIQPNILQKIRIDKEEMESIHIFWKDIQSLKEEEGIRNKTRKEAKLAFIQLYKQNAFEISTKEYAAEGPYAYWNHVRNNWRLKTLPILKNMRERLLHLSFKGVGNKTFQEMLAAAHTLYTTSQTQNSELTNKMGITGCKTSPENTEKFSVKPKPLLKRNGRRRRKILTTTKRTPRNKYKSARSIKQLSNKLAARSCDRRKRTLSTTKRSNDKFIERLLKKMSVKRDPGGSRNNSMSNSPADKLSKEGLSENEDKKPNVALLKSAKESTEGFKTEYPSTSGGGGGEGCRTEYKVFKVPRSKISGGKLAEKLAKEVAPNYGCKTEESTSVKCVEFPPAVKDSWSPEDIQELAKERDLGVIAFRVVEIINYLTPANPLTPQNLLDKCPSDLTGFVKAKLDHYEEEARKEHFIKEACPSRIRARIKELYTKNKKNKGHWKQFMYPEKPKSAWTKQKEPWKAKPEEEQKIFEQYNAIMNEPCEEIEIDFQQPWTGKRDEFCDMPVLEVVETIQKKEEDLLNIYEEFDEAPPLLSPIHSIPSPSKRPNSMLCTPTSISSSEQEDSPNRNALYFQPHLNKKASRFARSSISEASSASSTRLKEFEIDFAPFHHRMISPIKDKPTGSKSLVQIENPVMIPSPAKSEVH